MSEMGILIDQIGKIGAGVIMLLLLNTVCGIGILWYIESIYQEYYKPLINKEKKND